jgi:ornithine carbamoyltransferase
MGSSVSDPSFRRYEQSKGFAAPLTENHPFETLGDLTFVKSVCGSIDNLVVAAVASADNIIHSWAEAAAVIPLHLIQVAPRQLWLDRGRYGQGRITQTESMEVLSEADVIITDCWPRGASACVMNAFQITRAHLDRGKPGMMFIPCPPVTRGQEVSDDAMSHQTAFAFRRNSSFCTSRVLSSWMC